MFETFLHRSATLALFGPSYDNILEIDASRCATGLTTGQEALVSNAAYI